MNAIKQRYISTILANALFEHKATFALNLFERNNLVLPTPLNKVCLWFLRNEIADVVHVINAGVTVAFGEIHFFKRGHQYFKLVNGKETVIGFDGLDVEIQRSAIRSIEKKLNQL